MLEAFSALSLVHRIGVIAAGIVALVGAWLVVVGMHDAKVVSKERYRVEKQGEKIDAKAQARRADAMRDPGKLLDRYYRD